MRATVHRAGALTPNLVEDMEVFLIASPNEDDLEESENIIVERQWEDQMRFVPGGQITRDYLDHGPNTDT